MFERIVTGYGEHPALAVKRFGEWKKWTYKKYHEESMIAAKAMIEVRKTLSCFDGSVGDFSGNLTRLRSLKFKCAIH